jgi:serine phosphatase RsbU (regulator of sigma subunit)
VAGLEVAQRYLPVGVSVVGGDWHDIVPLREGRAALIVGDAMGHGPEAAAVMVQLRTAAHTLADLGLPPGQMLTRLDRIAGGMATTPFATCIGMVIDPAGSSCVAARAGHLPPVLVLPGGETRVLDLPPGLPLGVGAGSFTATQVSLPPGATIALYTDGLVESSPVSASEQRPAGQRPPFTRATAAVMARGSGRTAAPATSTVGVPLTPAWVARAVTYGGQSR